MINPHNVDRWFYFRVFGHMCRFPSRPPTRCSDLAAFTQSCGSVHQMLQMHGTKVHKGSTLLVPQWSPFKRYKACLAVHLQSQTASARWKQVLLCSHAFSLFLEQRWDRLVKCKLHSMSVALRRQVLQDRERMKAHAVGKVGLKMLSRCFVLGFLHVLAYPALRWCCAGLVWT